MTTAQRQAQTLGALAVTPRPLSDYRLMFLLTDDELRAGPILDCPAGASPFGAQARAVGGTVTSVDPVYAGPKAGLVARARADLRRIADWAAANPDQFDWTYLGSVESQIRKWDDAITEFAADYRRDGARYVAATLPVLPFPDRHFSLTLSSHLLFLYPEYLDFEAHVAALLELVRVTRGEVRVFPIVDTAAHRYSRLADIRSALADHGVDTEIRPANCAFTKGGDHLFAAWRADTAH